MKTTNSLAFYSILVLIILLKTIQFLPILFKSQKIRQIEAKHNHFVFPKVVFYAAQTWKTELNQVLFSRMAFQYFRINHFQKIETAFNIP